MRKRTDKEIGLIYFMRRADGVGPIKIGCSKWPQERLQALQIWSPEPLEIVATVPGTFADERRLHRQFDAHRLHGEWFEAAPPVLAAVSRAALRNELPPRPVSDRHAVILARFEGGETLQQIGDDFGITRERVRQIVKKEGGKARGKGNRRRTVPVWSKLDTVRRLAADGLSIPEIAAAIGDSGQNIRNACLKSGITVSRGKRKITPAVVERAFDIAADYKAGISGSKIARKYGIPAPTIYRFLRVAGVNPDRREAIARCTFDVAKVIPAYLNGATLCELATEHGVATATIRRALVRANMLRTPAQSEAIRRARVRAANAQRQHRTAEAA